MSNDDYDAKLEKALMELHEKKVPKMRYRTPMFRILRMFGVKIKPQFYYPDIPYFLCCTGYFSMWWGVLMWVAFLRSRDLSVNWAVGIALLAGVLFGLAMVAINVYYRRQYELTPWDEL